MVKDHCIKDESSSAPASRVLHRNVTTTPTSDELATIVGAVCPKTDLLVLSSGPTTPLTIRIDPRRPSDHPSQLSLQGEDSRPTTTQGAPKHIVEEGEDANDDHRDNSNDCGEAKMPTFGRDAPAKK